ncbi:MAG: hypothetical protein AB7N80_04680 [Bdellovibrionales bacterium]
MNKNISALLKAAVVSGFTAGSIAYADDQTTPPPADGASAPQAEGEKNKCKGHKAKHDKHAKGKKDKSGCNGKHGCGGEAEKKEEAPK